jgi:hypothetical protein
LEKIPENYLCVYFKIFAGVFQELRLAAPDLPVPEGKS